MHDAAPVTSKGTEQADSEDSDVTFERWMALWRSLILSSLGATAQPYCRFVRALDLQDLQHLLEQLDGDKQKGKYLRAFFDGPVGDFYVGARPAAAKTRSIPKMNLPATIEKIGDQLVPHTPMLEELMGARSADSLRAWVPSLPRLQHVRCWDSAVLDGVGPALAAHCPHFRSLTLFTSLDASDDGYLVNFFRDLREQSLCKLHIFSKALLSAAVFPALARHRDSLVHLDFGRLPDVALLAALPQLDVCPNLTTLHLDSDRADLEGDEAVRGLTRWLQGCAALRDLALTNVSNAPAILEPYLRQPTARLARLEVGGYASENAEDPRSTVNQFHNALACQEPTLRALSLRCAGERTDSVWLVGALSHLRHLTELRLPEISDYFTTSDILRLCAKLPELEELCVSGWDVKDEVWREPSGFRALRKLRRFDFNAYTRASFEALLSYVNSLELPGNHGIVLAVTMADPRFPLSEEEQAALQTLVEQRVRGRFEYALSRGTLTPNVWSAALFFFFLTRELFPFSSHFNFPFSRIIHQPGVVFMRHARRRSFRTARALRAPIRAAVPRSACRVFRFRRMMFGPHAHDRELFSVCKEFPLSSSSAVKWLTTRGAQIRMRIVTSQRMSKEFGGFWGWVDGRAV